MGAAQGRHEGASGPSHEERRGSHLFIEMEELLGFDVVTYTLLL